MRKQTLSVWEPFCASSCPNRRELVISNTRWGKRLSNFQVAFNSLRRRDLPSRSQLHEIYLQLGIACCFSQAGALCSTLQAFLRIIFVHGGDVLSEKTKELHDQLSRRGRKPGGGDPSCASCVTTVWPLRLGSVFGGILVRDPIHDAVSEGDAIDGLGKTPIIDQVGKPCLTQTARQCVVEILD